MKVGGAKSPPNFKPNLSNNFIISVTRLLHGANTSFVRGGRRAQSSAGWDMAERFGLARSRYYCDYRETTKCGKAWNQETKKKP